MFKEIAVRYDSGDTINDQAIICFQTNLDKDKMLVAYNGKEAEALLNICTNQGYLRELLDNQKKPETGFVNNVTVHFVDGNNKYEMLILATDIVLDNPEYLIITNVYHNKTYFNKKNIIYFEMGADKG